MKTSIIATAIAMTFATSVSAGINDWFIQGDVIQDKNDQFVGYQIDSETGKIYDTNNNFKEVGTMKANGANYVIITTDGTITEIGIDEVGNITAPNVDGFQPTTPSSPTGPETSRPHPVVPPSSELPSWGQPDVDSDFINPNESVDEDKFTNPSEGRPMPELPDSLPNYGQGEGFDPEVDSGFDVDTTERPRPSVEPETEDDFTNPSEGEMTSGAVTGNTVGIVAGYAGIEANKQAIQNNYAAIQQNKQEISNLQTRMNNVEEALDVAHSGVALSMAMNAIPSSSYVGETSVGAGIGSFEGKSAVAFGVTHRFEKVSVNVSVSTTGEVSGGAIGASYSF